MNAPASTFEHNGKQYVVVLAAGTFFSGTKRGDSVWLFGLDGKFVVEPSAPQSDTPSQPRTDAGD